jgi:hypothetical protein
LEKIWRRLGNENRIARNKPVEKITGYRRLGKTMRN